MNYTSHLLCLSSLFRYLTSYFWFIIFENSISLTSKSWKYGHQFGLFENLRLIPYAILSFIPCSFILFFPSYFYLFPILICVRLRLHGFYFLASKTVISYFLPLISISHGFHRGGILALLNVYLFLIKYFSSLLLLRKVYQYYFLKIFPKLRLLRLLRHRNKVIKKA